MLGFKGILGHLSCIIILALTLISTKGLQLHCTAPMISTIQLPGDQRARYRQITIWLRESPSHQFPQRPLSAPDRRGQHDIPMHCNHNEPRPIRGSRISDEGGTWSRSSSGPGGATYGQQNLSAGRSILPRGRQYSHPGEKRHFRDLHRLSGGDVNIVESATG